MLYNTANRVLSTYSLFLETFFGMKAPHKQGVDTLRSGLLNMSEQEENVGEDCLAHVFGGHLAKASGTSETRFHQKKHNQAQSRYMDPKSVRLPGTRLGHMVKKLTCNEPFMKSSITIQWLGRGATAAAGYQSVGPNRKYQGGWQPPAGYLPYATKKQAD